VTVTDLTELIGHWGYGAIFLFVVLGNVGVPVPEETILLLAGYLAWRRTLRLSLVLAVGVVSAVAGDNLGYWIGRRYGLKPLMRYSRRFVAEPKRFDSMRRFIVRYGPWGVFVARFLPGLRFLAGPLAGMLGLPVRRFVAANVLGALVYVPAIVGIGYAVGYGLGDYVERLRGVIGRVEHLVLAGTLVVTVAVLGWRLLRARRQP
jgi:membrane-associated protein